MTYTDLTDTVAAQAQRHTVILSFDSGNRDYFYNPDRNIEYPHVYFQKTTPNRLDELTSTLNGNIVVVDLPPSELTFGESSFTTDDGTVLESDFSWNRNGSTTMDSTYRTLEEMMVLVDANLPDCDFVNEAFTSVSSSNNLTRAIGWSAPITVTFDNPIDTSDIPVI